MNSMLEALAQLNAARISEIEAKVEAMRDTMRELYDAHGAAIDTWKAEKATVDLLVETYFFGAYRVDRKVQRVDSRYTMTASVVQVNRLTPRPTTTDAMAELAMVELRRATAAMTDAADRMDDLGNEYWSLWDQSNTLAKERERLAKVAEATKEKS